MIKYAKNYQTIVQQLKIEPKRVPKLGRQVHQRKAFRASWVFSLFAFSAENRGA